MSDDIYLIYYNGEFIGMLSDSESFWHLYEWLSDSNGVCNVITTSKDKVKIPEDVQDFNKMMSQFGKVELTGIISLDVEYDDRLI